MFLNAKPSEEKNMLDLYVCTIKKAIREISLENSHYAKYAYNPIRTTRILRFLRISYDAFLYNELIGFFTLAITIVRLDNFGSLHCTICPF